MRHHMSDITSVDRVCSERRSRRDWHLSLAPLDEIVEASGRKRPEVVDHRPEMRRRERSSLVRVPGDHSLRNNTVFLNDVVMEVVWVHLVEDMALHDLGYRLCQQRHDAVPHKFEDGTVEADALIKVGSLIYGGRWVGEW